jgi:hypothetical protein
MLQADVQVCDEQRFILVRIKGWLVMYWRERHCPGMAM